MFINAFNVEKKLFYFFKYLKNNILIFFLFYKQVHLTCGLEPKLVSVKEPNICEYLMEFELPSVCVLENSIYTKEPEREEL